MYKRIFLTAVIFIFAALCLTSCKDKSDYKFEKTDGGIKITEYTGESDEVIVPGEIEGQPVVAIGESAFESKPVKSVELPDSVKVIERYAFRNNGKLEKIRLSSGIGSIPVSAFNFCTSLKSVEIPDGVEEICENAFGASGLLEIKIPDSVKKIGNYAFTNCVGLRRFESGKNLEYIGNSVFTNCISLTEVRLNEGLLEIGEYAFYSCTSLKEIDFPSTVETVSEGVLSATALTEIRIPSGVKKIKSFAFSACKSLGEVYISPTVTEMSVDVFNECKGFTIYGVPDSQAEIYADTYGYKFQKYDFK